MRIAVDIDDTLSTLDRLKAGTAYLVRKNLPVRVKDENAHLLRGVFDWTEEEAISFLQGGGISLFTDAPVRDGARETLARLREEGHEIVIVTARTKEWFRNAEKVSRDWLEKRRIPYDEIVTDEDDKGRYCLEHGIDIIVDDNLQTCLNAQARGINAVLFVDKHNIARAHEVTFGGANWKQIDAAVHYIINSRKA